MLLDDLAEAESYCSGASLTPLEGAVAFMGEKSEVFEASIVLLSTSK